jgi:hypothetical protein
LTFEFLILDPKRLAAEEELLRTLFREQIATGEVAIEIADPNSVGPRCQYRARRSLCNCLAVSMTPRAIAADSALIAQWIPSGPVPQVILDGEPLGEPESDTPLDAWRELLLRLLQVWIQ